MAFRLKMRIGIIGYGVVGKAAAKTFSQKYELIKYDKYMNLDSFEDLIRCEYVFIMVPTPFDCSKGKVDDKAVTDSLEMLDKLNFPNIVIIKSTLPPGFCKKYLERYNLKICFNPEFLRESTTPDEDFKNQHTIVIGTDSLEIYESVKNMYLPIVIPKAKFYHTSLTEAEMIKCAQNAMLASRVALANVIYDACIDNSLEYDNIRKIAFDSFEILGPHMVKVPGPDGKRGFGGKCLPKDIRALNSVYNSDIFDKIINYNDTLRGDLSSVLNNFD